MIAVERRSLTRGLSEVGEHPPPPRADRFIIDGV
jgi:hypothetical protein